MSEIGLSFHMSEKADENDTPRASIVSNDKLSFAKAGHCKNAYSKVPDPEETYY